MKKAPISYAEAFFLLPEYEMGALLSIRTKLLQKHLNFATLCNIFINFAPKS